MLKPEHEAAIKQGGLRPNEAIAKVLIHRLMSMTPEQAQAIKKVLTPETAGALKVLLPELKELIDKGVTNGAG